MRKALLLLVVLAGFLTACENKYKDPDPVVMGYDYYPLEVGDYRVYDVMDIRFQFNNGDTTRFQIRERVDTSFHDQTGQLVYKIVRSIRDNTNRPWIDDSVMVVAKTERMVMLTKDNTKYVKMVFPVMEDGEWVADMFNTNTAAPGVSSKIRDGKEVYTYQKVGLPFQLKELNFDNTVTVIQNSPDIFNTRVDERNEIYAKGFGLIYRIFNRVVLSPCFPDYCPDGENYKLDGHERHEILIEHGKL